MPCTCSCAEPHTSYVPYARKDLEEEEGISGRETLFHYFCLQREEKNIKEKKKKNTNEHFLFPPTDGKKEILWQFVSVFSLSRKKVLRNCYVFTKCFSLPPLPLAIRRHHLTGMVGVPLWHCLLSPGISSVGMHSPCAHFPKACQISGTFLAHGCRSKGHHQHKFGLLLAGLDRNAPQGAHGDRQLPAGMKKSLSGNIAL